MYEIKNVQNIVDCAEVCDMTILNHERLECVHDPPLHRDCLHHVSVHILSVAVLRSNTQLNHTIGQRLSQVLELKSESSLKSFTSSLKSSLQSLMVVMSVYLLHASQSAQNTASLYLWNSKHVLCYR